jgi:Amt family ammonium transporter
VFAVTEYGGNAGLLEGNAVQVLYQAIGIGVVFVYDVIVTLIILVIVKMFIGLRVSKDVEQSGLDMELHGEVLQ